MSAFFHPTDSSSDVVYRNVSAPRNRYERKAQRLTERMWATCGRFIDPNSDQRARKNDFYAVWWELFVAYALSRAGVELVPTSARPSVGRGCPDLLTANPRVWIEAVMPQPGCGADALREPPLNEVYSVPTESFVLRLRTAIEEKSAKLARYLADGTIQPGEPTIIAVSGARLPFRFTEPLIPRIVRAVYGVGDLVVEINCETMKQVGTASVAVRDRVLKKSNQAVATDVFTRKESGHVSAILYSSSDCVNYPRIPGADFILAHNPNADVPVPDDWLPVGEQFYLDGQVLRRIPAALRPVVPS